jgi:bifunctional UDP-N-acetylglucosamine pyrophosphorylase/glucosamine-1-phosphate N-acetyltransferase
MKSFNGNKTLMPLVPDNSPFEGARPILLQIVDSLPSGPKAVIVNHKKQDVIEATRGLGLTYCDQPSLNGTGGALIVSRPFLEGLDSAGLIITMGDVPFVKRETYLKLVTGIKKTVWGIGNRRHRGSENHRMGILESISGRKAEKT